MEGPNASKMLGDKRYVVIALMITVSTRYYVSAVVPPPNDRSRWLFAMLTRGPQAKACAKKVARGRLEIVEAGAGRGAGL